MSLYDVPLDKPTILVLGNEGHGMRTNILRRCTHLVRIGEAPSTVRSSISSSDTTSGSSDSGTMNSITDNSSNDIDIQYQRNLRLKFPFLTLQNPVFFDTPVVLLNTKHGIFDSAAAILHNNSGNIYITIDYFMYYSTSSIFSNNSEIIVIPLRSVKFMELVDVDSSIAVRCS